MFDTYLCVSQCLKRHLLVGYFCNRISGQEKTKLWKIIVFQRSVDYILIKLCLVVNFKHCVKVFTICNFFKLPKICYFWIHFRLLQHYEVTTLEVVGSGSPQLSITKQFIGAICQDIQYQLLEIVCQMKADTYSQLSVYKSSHSLG